MMNFQLIDKNFIRKKIKRKKISTIKYKDWEIVLMHYGIHIIKNIVNIQNNKDMLII
jgi:hypothetical protein